ncbi:MAG TPA: YebC/PmpR family DNA-binding transcriptional regulator [Patescibacteria group bacterium]|nr:YebC/PmpR family DNA-binding transcriptional regulator [Patescibacteria group bacterium]
MAGHSKWANIKHKKAVTDARRGKIFTRLVKEIIVAAREGGGNPDANPRLRMAIQNARAQNVPSENIKRGIQRGTGELEGVSYEQIIYEGFAPASVAILVETLTDNRNRTVAELRALFNKYGGSFGEAGSVAWNFQRKGVVQFDSNGASEDDILMHVLQCEADDAEFSDYNSVRVISPPEQLAQTQKYFEEQGFTVSSAAFEYLPNTTAKISDTEDLKKFTKFMDALEDYDDVQNIFSNVEIDESIAAEEE